MRKHFLWLGPLLLCGFASCVSLPQYSDHRTELEAKESPLKTATLGVVYSDNIQRAFEYIEENKKLAKVAYPLAVGDIGSEKVTDKLNQVLTRHFKSVVPFATIEEALKQEVDMIMTFDLLCALGQRTGSKTKVDITATFLDRNQHILEEIKASGKATALPWTYRFTEVLKSTFDQFEKNLSHSQKLKIFVGQRGVISPLHAELPETQRVKGAPYYHKSWAVVIGINKYDVWPPLAYAVTDALAVEKKLKEIGFEEVIEILDKEATRKRILTLLGTELPKKVGSEDRVVIFFAGHGQTESLADGREQGYIIPADGDITNYFATAISMTQVRELSQRIPAKHLLYAMDACYSGQGFSRAFGIDPAIKGYIEKITSLRSVQMITAGGKGEQVMEQQGHGVFTEYLLRGLNGEADRDNDGVVTASELGAFLMPEVSRASGNFQTPQYGRLDGEGEMVFFVSQNK